MKTQHTPGTRLARNGQFVPTIDGKDTSPTSFDEQRALQIAKEQIENMELKIRHTPGPWRIHPQDPEKVVSSSQGIAVMSGMFRESLERKANARLIAASPEMLVALEYVVRWHRENDSGEGELFGRDYVTSCITAIRQAKGQL